MKRNPDIARPVSRSPIVEGSLMTHMRRAYGAARAQKGRFPIMQGIVGGIRDKIDAERVLTARPPFKPNPNKIIIDVTFFCNMGCQNCNRSCGDDQANVQEHMSLGQIKRFVSESVAQGRRWSEILLEGGEPTLNPQILEIADELARYKREHSPHTRIVLCTNGHAAPTRRIMAMMPPEIDVHDSGKEDSDQDHHRNFNVAPIDLSPEQADKFADGCVLPSIYGMGLNRYGYYPHGICGAVDRVFGLDVGRKTLPPEGDTLSDMYRSLCRYCGHFWDCTNIEEPEAPARTDGKDAPPCTESWTRAYSTYAKRKPELRLY